MGERYRTLGEDRYDAIVVGAGLGGLTAAALMAARGQKVLVLDQHYVAGGNATVFKRRGYEFDVGIHYVGGCHEEGVIPRILRAADVRDLEFEEMDPDGYDTLVFPDFTFRVPKGIDAFRKRLIERFPAEGRGIDRYISLLRQIEAMQDLPGRPVAALWTVPRSVLLMRWAGRTFGDFLDSCTSDPRLKAVLAGQNGDYAQPPSRASVLVGAGLTLHYLEGAYFPRGGGQIMSDRLADSIERHGGKILLRARVERIVVEGGRVGGVELYNKHVGHRRVNAPVVVSNADLKRTMLDLVGEEHLAQDTVRRIRRYEMSPALGILYLGIDRNLRAEGHPRTNYWIYSGYDLEPQYAETAAGRFAEDPFAFVSIASVKDPTNDRLAPEGVTNMQVMALAPHQLESWGVTQSELEDGSYRKNPAYRRHKEDYAERLLAGAARVFPDIRDQVVYREVATPVTHRRFAGSTGGTSYGIALTPAQFLQRRPGAKTEIEGLLLCGASCRSGHGVGGVTVSGLTAAAAVVGRPLFREVFSSNAALARRRELATVLAGA